jgi:hypothetical protein
MKTTMTRAAAVFLWTALGAATLARGADRPASPPADWIDAATGHRIVRLSTEANTRSIYFHQNAITPDGRFLLVEMQDGLGVIEIATRKNIKLVDGKVRALFVGRRSGLLYFSRSPVDATYLTDVLPAMVLLGLGAGLSFPSLMNLAMSGAHQDDAGLASGLVNTTMQVGGALGLAVIATLATSRTESLLNGGDAQAQAQALTGGFHLAFLVGAGLVTVAIGIALAVLEPLPAPALEEAGEETAAPAEFGEPAYSEAA